MIAVLTFLPERVMLLQALQKSLLEFQHAPLHLEPKLDYMERKKQDRSTALLVEVRVPCLWRISPGFPACSAAELAHEIHLHCPTVTVEETCTPS